jgi:hypothetical protein
MKNGRTIHEIGYRREIYLSALALLYKKGCLSVSEKHAILAQRQQIEQPAMDQSTCEAPTDCTPGYFYHHDFPGVKL